MAIGITIRKGVLLSIHTWNWDRRDVQGKHVVGENPGRLHYSMRWQRVKETRSLFRRMRRGGQLIRLAGEAPVAGNAVNPYPLPLHPLSHLLPHQLFPIIPPPSLLHPIPTLEHDPSAGGCLGSILQYFTASLNSSTPASDQGRDYASDRGHASQRTP